MLGNQRSLAPSTQTSQVPAGVQVLSGKLRCIAQLYIWLSRKKARGYDNNLLIRAHNFLRFLQPITADTFRAEIEVVEHCDCADLTLWLVVILVFKVVILLTGGFLAWQTRRVYIPSLNDTQHCASCVFVVVLFCLVGSIVAFTTTMYPSAYYGVIGALIIIATTLILVLLFTNKVGLVCMVTVKSVT